MMGKKRFAGRAESALDSMDWRARSGKRFITAGIMASVIDPPIGIPIAVPGIALALGETIGKGSFRKHLLKKPKAAMLLAKKFRGTKHEAFFEEILAQIEKNKQREMMKKYAGLKASKRIPLRVGLKRLFKK